MKKTLLCFSLLVLSAIVFSQDLTKFHLYKPEENAAKEISKSVQAAKASGKYVLIQIGGNWCSWCARFHDFITADKQIDSLLNKDFIIYHLNYSKENKNLDILTTYGYPQRFGFPVFLVLDGNGKLIHTQNSGLLEDGKGYSKDKVFGFLNDWRPGAFEPQQYKE
ncbi:MAG: thioredoxin family protein [Bacteroidota bacterium]